MTGDGPTRRRRAILEEQGVVLDMLVILGGLKSVGLQHIFMMDGSILP